MAPKRPEPKARKTAKSSVKSAHRAASPRSAPAARRPAAKSAPAKARAAHARIVPAKPAVTKHSAGKPAAPARTTAPLRPAVPSRPAPPAKPATPAKPTVATPPPVAEKKPAALIAKATKGVIAIAVRTSNAPPLAVSGENDDGSNSLLAGPRNVTPYVAKRGEQYMSKAQLDHFTNILQTWKRDLMQEVDRTVSHMKDEAANFPDPNDRATQEEEFSLELRTRDRERKLIRKIDEALGRIEDGTYGYCLETGEEIGIKRLEARPVATLSIEAQERRERRERQYGDRDDRYR